MPGAGAAKRNAKRTHHECYTTSRLASPSVVWCADSICFTSCAALAEWQCVPTSRFLAARSLTRCSANVHAHFIKTHKKRLSRSVLPLFRITFRWEAPRRDGVPLERQPDARSASTFITFHLNTTTIRLPVWSINYCSMALPKGARFERGTD